MRVGFGKFDITPPLGVSIGGQPFEKKADSVESPLYAKAMCIENDGQITLIISCDLLLFPTELADEIRKLISENIPVRLENIFIAATHTHSGPNTGKILGVEMENQYLDVLPAKILEVAQKAYNGLTEAALSVTSTQVKGLAFNRRYIMRDGTVQTHPLKNDPNIVGAEGTSDPELGVIYASDLDGKFLGGVINFACHATVMERESTTISADYPGYATKFLAEIMNPDSTVLFLNGPCGNICQVDPLNPESREIGSEWAKLMGEKLANAAKKAIDNNNNIIASDIKVVSNILNVPLRKVDDYAQKKAGNVLESECSSEIVNLSDYGTEIFRELPEDKLSLADYFDTSHWSHIEASDMLEICDECKCNPDLDIPLSILFGNNFSLIAIPGELFAELGLEIKQRSPFKYTFISELTNGQVGYIPTEIAFTRVGGYETKYLSSSKLAKNAGRLLTEKIVEMLNEQYE